MTPKDFEEVATFYKDIRLDTVPVIHSLDETTWFLGNILSPRGSSYVFEQEGKILGWLDIYDGWVDQLYCRRGETGKSIGKQMLDFAKQRFPDGLQLWTFQANSGARGFYQREGFVEVEWTDGANNEEKAPDVRLVWNPKPMDC